MDVLIDRRVFERMQEDFSGWYALKDTDEIGRASCRERV